MSILTDKQYKNYDRVSRYHIFPIYYNNNDGKYMYGLTSNLKTSDCKFVAHQLKDTDTLDSLALYYYGNPTYYWIIADFNRIRDPYQDLSKFKYLKIPTFSGIEFMR